MTEVDEFVEELREYCENLWEDRQNELEYVLDCYFSSVFIEGHLPFRAVIGNKKCKPVPIHRSFIKTSGGPNISDKFMWPNISEELIREELKRLGFVVTEGKICISVPAYKKGEKLSYAQKWVKEINDCYAAYCAGEKREAKEVYSDLLSDLFEVSTESIKIYKDYVLFYDFKYGEKISAKCLAYVRKMMKDDGIGECVEDGKYMGIKVYRSQSIN